MKLRIPKLKSSKYTICLFATYIGWFSTCVMAQDTLRMDIDECIAYALKNNTSIKNTTLDEEMAGAKVKEVRGLGLPQITGSAGLQHYFKLQKSIFSGYCTFLLPRNPQTGALLYPNADQIVNENFFQLPTSLDANITASQLLFSASYLVGLQAAKTYKELTQKSAQQTREQTAVNVKKAYFQQLINQERLKLFDINLVRIDSSLRQMKALQKNGFAEQIEIDRMEVNLNNLLTEYEKTLNLLVLSALSLKFQMGMPLEQNLVLKDALQKFLADTSFNSDSPANIKNRSDYQLLQLQLKANKLEHRNNVAGALPTLAVQGTLGYFSSNNDLNIFKNRNILVPGGSEKIQPLFWSDYSYFQIGLNVPIFGGGRQMYKRQQSALNIKKTENNIKSMEQSMMLQVQMAKVNVLNSYRSMKIQKRNMDLAQKVNNTTYLKYKNGVVTNLEMTLAESSLKEAQINYFNVLYEYLVNKADYELAAGMVKY